MSLRLEPWVLDLLRCPLTGQPLAPVVVDGVDFLATPDGIRYPVLDGVPVLLVDEAVRPSAGIIDRPSAGPVTRPSAGPVTGTGTSPAGGDA
ncbi:MAG: Trm112 family protein [Janthinobacterium lividum]